jgi:hypothetical protein
MRDAEGVAANPGVVIRAFSFSEGENNFLTLSTPFFQIYLIASIAVLSEAIPSYGVGFCLRYRYSLKYPERGNRRYPLVRC